MADTDILVSEMTPASQINTTDLMIMTQPDAQAETGYSTKSGTVLQVANKMLKGTEYSTDLPDFTDKTPLGGLEELKADIKALLPVDSASGNPCNFETDIADTLVSLKAAILVSGGNGTPSTPIPILGHSELNLVRCGKNLVGLIDGTYSINGVDVVISNGKITANGTATSGGGRLTALSDTFYLPAGTYFINSFNVGSGITPYLNNADGNTAINTGDNRTFVLSATTRVFFGVNVTNGQTYNNVELTPMINIGSTPSPYVAYNGTPYLVSFGQTVYGGVYDANAGKVNYTYSQKVNLAELSWNYQGQNCFYAMVTGAKTGGILKSNKYKYTDISIGSTRPDLSISLAAYYGDSTISIKDENYSDVASFVASLTGADCIYELATPIEIDVSSLSVDTIVGVNNIISDGGGDVEVQYRDSIQHYIDSKIASVQALIL